MKVDKDENEVVSDHLEQVEEVDSEVNIADAEKNDGDIDDLEVWVWVF